MAPETPGSPAHDLVIRGGRLVTAAGEAEGDLAVSGGRIAALGAVPGRGAREIDATGRLVCPGGVDPHCHIEQRSGMGLMNADSFESATRSAALGGTTSVVSFAAQAKGQPLAEALEDYAARARRGAMVDYAFHLMITDPEVPGFAADLARAMAAGHRTAKVFTTYAIALSDPEILRVMELVRAAHGMLCIHAETDALIDRARHGLLARGLTRPVHHALSHPRLAEIDAVARMIRFAEFTGCPVMLFHISTAEAAALVAEARARGAPVAAETCPHYLLTDARVLDRPGVEGAKWMCSPPQRTMSDAAALWSALFAGTLDLVSSDHAPYRFDETGKLAAGPAPAFPEIANGLPGLETRLPLMFDAIVSEGRGTASDFVRLTATAPARLHGLAAKGDLAEGRDADIVLWNPETRVTFGADDLHDNVGYNPWEGRTVTGWPERVFLRGQEIAEAGCLLARPGQGRPIDRPATGLAPAPPAPELVPEE